MKLVSIIFFVIIAFFSACISKNEFKISIEVNSTNFDTLIIKELISGMTMAKIPLDKLNQEYTFDTDETKLALLSINGIDAAYLTIISPGMKKTLLIDSAFIITKQSISDSLINYIAGSTNQILSEHSNDIFTQDNPQKVKFIFDSLVQAKHKILNTYKSQLTDDEFGILDYQNKARANSFLFYYGRIIKKYLPDNEFFSFINTIDNEDIYSKTLPDNILYKYEIQILTENDSIENVDAFLKYIETRTRSKDLQDFLKAVYLENVIEHPSYWRHHKHLFTTTSIKDALQRESANKYAYLINKASGSFYASQRGAKGFDFTAYRLNGTPLNLSDLKDKIIVMYIWATWCGPCIEQRPGMIKLAEKYKENHNIVFLMVSVDRSVDQWKKYVTRTNGNKYGIDVNIPDGMNEKFGYKYLIKAIPKYFLIDKEGIIIDANLPEPSIGMEQMIESINHKFLNK